MKAWGGVWGLALVWWLSAGAYAAPYITVASTTSIQNSGLYEHLLPQFTAASGMEVRVVALGTGAALRLARNGDADVLLVHHAASERRFVADGYGVARHPLMYNDFVLVGPDSDPADVYGIDQAPSALRRIAERGALFASPPSRPRRSTCSLKRRRSSTARFARSRSPPPRPRRTPPPHSAPRS